MARSAPTYTPIRNYAIGFFLSVILLFNDVSHGTFNPIRGYVNASTLYVKIISNSILENINNTFHSFEKNRSLLNENKELRETILEIRTKEFVERKNSEEKLEIFNFQKELPNLFYNNDIDIYKIASVDLRNYLCCSTHRIFLQNINNLSAEKNVPVYAGGSFVGQTMDSYLGFIEVILFSDSRHILPIKSNFFYCDARGKGRPMMMSCKLNKSDKDFKNQVGDTVYTSGLGGIFLKDIEIGSISAINTVSINEIEVLVTLKINPLEETFYGMMRK